MMEWRYNSEHSSLQHWIMYSVGFRPR